MNRRNFAKILAALAGASVIGCEDTPPPAAKQSPQRLAMQPKLSNTVPQVGIMAPVLKRGYDNGNTGSNLAEKVFTQAAVQTRGIRKYFSLPMEGDARGCEAQPLIVPSVVMDDGTTRDICIVASMNNTVWCYDANDSDILW